MKKRKLEIILEDIPQHPAPKIEYEQYTSPVHLVSRMLWIAEMKYHDISGKKVVDLGAGTGRLGIGAILLGAEEALLIDIDDSALLVAKNSLRKLRIDNRSHLVVADIRKLELPEIFDTVVQNPPFGVHIKGMDIIFLNKALEIAKTVYSVHKSTSVNYVINYLSKRNLFAEILFEEEIILPPTYNFHRKLGHKVDVTVIRVLKVGKNTRESSGTG